MLLVLKTHGRDGRIIELACGDGSLAAAIDFPVESYVGYDISPEAIAQAKRAVPNRDFRAGSLEDWRPEGSPTLVVIEEAIYYLDLKGQRAVINRALSAGAQVLIAIHDRMKHAKTLANCMRGFSHGIAAEGQRVYLVLYAPA